MNILVTGGAGFIGSHFIRRWLAGHENDSIINLDALTYAGNPETVADLATHRRYRFVEGDITDRALVAEIMPEVDLIVHFAAESHVDRSIDSDEAFIRTNVEGTRVLLEAARRSGRRPRFHHVSTDEVYGSLSFEAAPFTEDSRYDPRSPYSASKAASDHLVRAYIHTHGLPATISNCGNNYGPYQFPEKFVPRSITRLLAGRPMPLYGTGANVRDWIYVEDHVAGIERVIERGRLGETYCLGGGNELSNLDMARALLAELNMDETMIEYVTDRPGHDLRYALDYSKARSELGWEPEVDFKEGLKRTVAWYRENGAWLDTVKRRTFV